MNPEEFHKILSRDDLAHSRDHGRFFLKKVLTHLVILGERMSFASDMRDDGMCIGRTTGGTC